MAEIKQNSVWLSSKYGTFKVVLKFKKEEYVIEYLTGPKIVTFHDAKSTPEVGEAIEWGVLPPYHNRKNIYRYVMGSEIVDCQLISEPDTVPIGYKFHHMYGDCKIVARLEKGSYIMEAIGKQTVYFHRCPGLDYSTIVEGGVPSEMERQSKYRYINKDEILRYPEIKDNESAFVPTLEDHTLVLYEYDKKTYYTVGPSRFNSAGIEIVDLTIGPHCTATSIKSDISAKNVVKIAPFKYNVDDRVAVNQNGELRTGTIVAISNKRLYLVCYSPSHSLKGHGGKDRSDNYNFILLGKCPTNDETSGYWWFEEDVLMKATDKTYIKTSPWKEYTEEMHLTYQSSIKSTENGQGKSSGTAVKVCRKTADVRQGKRITGHPTSVKRKPSSASVRHSGY